MCGIAGFYDPRRYTSDPSGALAAMVAPLTHRGPDDSGIWQDYRHGIALGHRRLSILDLSSTGHQPMSSACGRFVIAFNGEIYNHLEIREELKRLNAIPQGGWRGHTDTETLLAAIYAWGLQKTLVKTVGMFALAVWDKDECCLSLARDRMGEKPLYYGWQNGVLLFASELKGLRAHPSFIGDVDWDAANTFLRLNYIPAPSTIYRGIHKLVPGTFLQFELAQSYREQISSPISYWSLNESAIKGLTDPFQGSFTDAVDELESLVRRAVKLQSVADVPVGAFLSGGIDSSTVVAMMQSATKSNVTTFSIGMPDARMDESKYAAEVAKYLGTNHIEHIIKPTEALDLIPQLSKIWDEPFGDSSQIPTYLVSQLAKQHVTVALSGDGGDEFFLGYDHYNLYQKLWHSRWLRKLPWLPLMTCLSALSGTQRVQTALRRGKSIMQAWQEQDMQKLNRYWMDRYRNSDVPLLRQGGIQMLDFSLMNDPATTAGLWDAGTYLPDDILVKVDRAAMANSLETRAPLLDHRIADFAFRLPLEYKLNQGVGKKVLRSVLYRQVPEKLVNRPKMGFSIPLSAWLKNELRPWTESLLAHISNDDEFFNKPMIDQLWKEHLSGERVHTEKIWGILSLISFTK